MFDKTIPANLDKAILWLENNLYQEDRVAIQAMVSENEIFRFHHSLGQWMRNEWGLWNGSVLKDYFLEMGIKHADDMSGIILTSYWRKTHNQPIDLDRQVQFYKDFWNGKDNNY